MPKYRYLTLKPGWCLKLIFECQPPIFLLRRLHIFLHLNYIFFSRIPLFFKICIRPCKHHTVIVRVWGKISWLWDVSWNGGRFTWKDDGSIQDTCRGRMGPLDWQNEMNGALGHLCAHIDWTGPREPPEDGEMNKMTLPSRHRIRNSSPDDLRLSTLPLGHGGPPQYLIMSERRRNIFVSLKLEGQSGGRTGISDFPSRQL